jgi:hypothetical protein
MKVPPLSLKEETFLTKIIESIAFTGKGPTIREAQKIGGFSSSRTAAQYLDQLAEKGYIERGSAPRSLRILIDPRDARPARKRSKKKGVTQATADDATSVRPTAALLVDSTDLVGWSNRRDAQSMLPQVVRKLVYATTDGRGTVHFRSGEGVQLPGFDGFTEFDTRTSFVPAGPAVWEIGTSGDAERKAQSDYRARTDEPLELDPATATFVFVTSRRWREKSEWVRRRRADKVWRDVRAYDADDLESWLELAPGVHRWLSRAVGKGADGATDLAAFASDWYAATKPALSAEFLLAGRSGAVDKVKEWISSNRTTLAIRAESREEGVVFFDAALQELSENEREHHELRSVVVANDTAWQQLAVSRDPLILIPTFMPSSVATAERNGHRVILPLTAADRGAIDPVDIGVIDREAVEKVLGKLHANEDVSDNKVRELAHLARRSVMAFRRVRGRTPELSQPNWSTRANGPTLALVMLVGAWKDTRQGDREVVSRIVGMPYAQIERELVRWAHEADAPVRHIGDRWLVVSKEDCWPLLHGYLTRDDLRRFHDVAVDVLSTVDPRLELEQQQQWMTNIPGKVPPRSGTILNAIANTLALLGTRGDATRPTAGDSASAIAASAVRTLLDAANKDFRVWRSVADVLPLLAEAAPSQFLEAIEKGLAGPTPVLRDIFMDKPGTSSLTTSSPHVEFLWALERLGWAPEYLPRAASALAKLAVLDEPRGTITNRPDASLRRLFLCWHPQTHALLEQRLDVLDRLRKSHPAIAWRLLVCLLPNDHDFSMNHQPAEWREWGVEPPRLLRVDVSRGYKEVIARVIEDVAEDAAHWKDLIQNLEKIPRENALGAIEKLEKIPAERFDAAAGEILRSALRESISWHRAHPDAKWELTVADVARMEAIHATLEPVDVEERHRWLFTRAPELLDGAPSYSDEYNNMLCAQRVSAVKTIFGTKGLEGLLKFAMTVEMPNEVGGALALSDTVNNFALDIIRQHLATGETALYPFARGFTFEQIRKRGLSWLQDLIRGDAQRWTAAHRGILLTFLPYDDSETWKLVEEQDAEGAEEYWRRMYPWGLPESRIEDLTRNLIKHGRPFTAADVLASHLHSRAKRRPSPELIADTLEAVLGTDRTDDPVPSHFGYDLGELAETLAKDPGSVPLPRIAAIEWALVPLLSNHNLEPRILHGELARDPAFFAEVVSVVYRAEGEDSETREFTEDDRLRTRAAYKLLESCRTFPARRPDGTINVVALSEWVTEVRRLLAEGKRTEAGDSRIGNILGTSPLGEDGLWPHEAVREVVEQIESSDVERGIALRVYNSRGVVSKNLREGGAQERDLVRTYTSYANAMNEKSPRTAALLRRIAEFYETDATRSDTDVELRNHLEH